MSMFKLSQTESSDNETPSIRTIKEYFGLYTNKIQLNSLWRQLENAIGKDDFIDKCREFLVELDSNYISWEGTNKLELHAKNELHSDTFPLISHTIAEFFVGRFNWFAKEVEEKDDEESYTLLLDISFLLYKLMMPIFNRKTFIEASIIPSLLSILTYFIENMPINEIPLLTVYYLFSTLVNTFSNKESDYENTTLKVFIRYIKGFKEATFSEKVYTVFISLLESLSKSLISKTFAQRISVSKVVDHLLDYLGFPDKLAINFKELKEKELIFNLQMRILDVISSCFTKKASLIRWLERNGERKIMDFILWSSINFSTQEFNSSDYETDFDLSKNLNNWTICNRNLKLIFDELIKMILNCNAYEKKKASSPRTKASLFINTILSMFIKFFDQFDSVEDQYMKYIIEIPELQINIIFFYKKLLEQFPHYESYIFAHPIFNIFDKKPFHLRSNQTLVDITLQEDEKHISKYLKSVLVRLIFEFLMFISISHRNEEAIIYLLKLIQHYIETSNYTNLEIASNALSSITNETDFFFESFKKFGLADLARLIVILSERIQEDQNDSLITSRKNLGYALTKVLNQDEGRKFILNNYAVYEEIISICLFDQLFTKSFSIPFLVRFMSYPADESAESYSRLYSRYVDTIPKAQSKMGYDISKYFIDGITEVLREVRAYDGGSIELYTMKIKEKQLLFKQSDVFNTLNSLFEDCKTDDESLGDLCLSFIRCLTSLMKNNNQNKEYFKKTIGYNKLEKIILLTHKNDSSYKRKLILELVRMMLDGRYPIGVHISKEDSVEIMTESPMFAPPQISVTPYIANPSVAHLLIRLAQHFSKDERTMIFKSLNDLAKNSSVNITKMCSEGVLELCIDVIKSYNDSSEYRIIFELISTLSAFNLTVKEFSRILHLFDPFNNEFRSQWTSNLLLSLEQMINKGQGPRHYFDFDGFQAALEIPTLPRWPLDGKGFTFCTSIRIESFVHPHTNEMFSPRLFSFTDDEGNGYELLFDEVFLSFQVLLPNQKVEKKSFSYEFREKQWYTIVFSFSFTNRIITKSAEIKLTVFSDFGIEHEKETINKCSIFQKLHHCYIGSVSDTLLKLRNYDNFYTFYGQMSDIYFFDGEVSHERFKEFLENCNPIQDEQFSLFDHFLPGKTIMKYSPMTIDMNAKLNSNSISVSSPICYDLSHQCRDAKILVGLNIVHRNHARHLLSCIGGGIHILFPLIPLLEDGSGKAITDKAFEDQEVTPKKYYKVKRHTSHTSTSSQLLDQITRILCKVLSSSTELQEQMIESRGFSIFAYLVLRLSPHHLSRNFLTILLDNLDISSLSNRLKEDIIEFLLLDFHLWVYTGFDVQKQLLTKVIPFALSATKNSRNSITVQRLLENIRTFYWTVPSSDSMATEDIIESKTKKVIATRPTLEELGLLRGYTMHIVNELLVDGISFEDTKAIMQFLVDCKDPVLREEMFFKARIILEQHPHRKSFLEHIIAVGYEVLLYPLKDCSEENLHGILSFICILHSSCVSHTKEEFPTSVICDLLKDHIEYEDIYKYLFDVAVGLYTKKDSPERHFLGTGKKGAIQIKNSFIIQVILKLASTDKNLNNKYRFLEDFKELIDADPSNREILFNIPCWEMYLLTFFTEEADEDNPFYGIENSIGDIITSMFSSITIYRIMEDVNSIDTLCDYYCWYKAASTYLGISSLDDKLILYLNSIVDPILAELIAYSENDHRLLHIFENIQRKVSPVFTNVIQLIFFVTDVMSFYVKSIGDAMILFPSYRKSKILYKLIEIINIIEETSSFPRNVENSPLSLISFKKGIFKCPSGIPLIYRLLFLQIYTNKDVDILKRCLSLMEKRILEKGTKKEVVFYVTFHALNSLSLTATFLSQNKNNSEDIEWMKVQASYILPSLRKVFKLYKTHFAQLKRFDIEDLEYLQELIKSANHNLLLSQPRHLEGIISTLRYTLSDILRIDNEACNTVDKFIQRNTKQNFNKFIQHQNYEAEVMRKTYWKIESIMSNYFNDCERIVSRDGLMKYYPKVSRRWKNVLKTLKGAHGLWGNKETIKYWKLDKSENKYRMRLKLVQNVNYSDHKDALKKSVERNKEVQFTNQIDLNVVNKFDILSSIQDADTGRPDIKFEPELENFVDIKERDREKTLYVTECELVQPLRVTKGVLEITTKYVYFKERRDSSEEISTNLKEKSWGIDQIRIMLLGRYLMKRTSIEFFLTNNTSYYINFQHNNRLKVYNIIKGLNPSNLIREYNKEVFMNKWIKREISNFEYIMALNTLAGRTYNDLSQYPVFPWILKDYESDTIDINDVHVYRDLSKPVGALNEERLKEFIERSESLTDNNRKFLYGSHYSSASTVLFYLLRVEPFTTYSIAVNDNSFDHPDRMFFSIPQTFKNCLKSTSDVKELIPEFFYFPEMLINMNNFDFGKRQNGEYINDVELPKWAKSPEDFIRINRAALESEYVSQNLHKWIDLIFGCNQVGQRAYENYNTFHYLSYEGVVDIDKIEDPEQKEAYITMITEFGQTPMQLFTEAHPPRGEPIKQDLIHPIQPKTQRIGNKRIVWLGINSKKGNIVCVDSSGKLYLINKSSFLNSNDSNQNFKKEIFEEESRLILPHLNSQYDAFCLSKAGDILFAPLLDMSGLKCINLETKKKQIFRKHIDLITALALSEDGTLLITGSRDTTLIIWNIETKNGVTHISESISKLHGHIDEITCVAINTILGICISSSKDNICIIHNLKDYSYIRDLYHDSSKGNIDKILLSIEGYIIIYSKPNYLHLYSMNARYIRSIDAPESPTCIVVSNDGKYLITGSKDSIYIRTVHDFNIIRNIYVDGIVVSINLDDEYLIAGLEDGRILLLGLNYNVE